MKAIFLKVMGQVQGVFFRAETKKQADALHITGWVRNTDDGSVEIFSQGEDAALKKLEEWALNGPPAAQVKEVVLKKSHVKNLPNFEIRH